MKEESDKNKGVFGLLAFALLLFHIGGWSIMFGTDYNTVPISMFYRDAGAHVFRGKELVTAVRFDKGLYGVRVTNRYFDSPFLSIVCLVISALILSEVASRVVRAIPSESKEQEECANGSERGEPQTNEGTTKDTD